MTAIIIIIIMWRIKSSNKNNAYILCKINWKLIVINIYNEFIIISSQMKRPFTAIKVIT